MSKCRVKDGRFVEPCESLSGAVDNNIPSFSKARGVAIWRMTNIKTGKPSRTYFGLKSKKHQNGFLFNFCPWCGVAIDAPFSGDDEGNK